MVSKMDDRVWILWLAMANDIQDRWSSVYIIISYD
jgi:hypothetical protein